MVLVSAELVDPARERHPIREESAGPGFLAAVRRLTDRQTLGEAAAPGEPGGRSSPGVTTSGPGRSTVIRAVLVRSGRPGAGDLPGRPFRRPSSHRPDHRPVGQTGKAARRIPSRKRRNGRGNDRPRALSSGETRQSPPTGTKGRGGRGPPAVSRRLLSARQAIGLDSAARASSKAVGWKSAADAANRFFWVECSVTAVVVGPDAAG